MLWYVYERSLCWFSNVIRVFVNVYFYERFKGMLTGSLFISKRGENILLEKSDYYGGWFDNGK